MKDTNLTFVVFRDNIKHIRLKEKSMLNQVMEKLLDFFVENEVIYELERNKFFQPFIKKIRDREFMIPIMKYLLFGFLTTVISLGSFWLFLRLTNWNENVCNFLSIVLGILSAYILNRNYVFESKEKNILEEFSKFVMARIASTLFDMVSFYIFATCLSFNEMIVKVIISIVVVILNYFLSKILVFKKKENEKNMS